MGQPWWSVWSLVAAKTASHHVRGPFPCPGCLSPHRTSAHPLSVAPRVMGGLTVELCACCAATPLLPLPRPCHPRTAYKIYVTGGRDCSANRLASCEVFSTARGRWARLPSMKCVRSSGCASHTSNGRVLAVAGHDGRANLMSAEEYDPVANKWTSVRRRAYCSATVNRRCRVRSLTCRVSRTMTLRCRPRRV